MGTVYEEYLSAKQPVSDRQKLIFIRRFVTKYYKVLSDSFHGDTYYASAVTAKGKFILLCTCFFDKKGWSWNMESESVGPLHYACPLKILQDVPEPECKYAKDWRRRVEKYWEKQKAC